jgi:N-acetylmuramoyl-L-alanine amidase
VPTSAGRDGALPVLRRVENHLKEFIIVLDPGHGGKDPGAVSKDGRIKEKDITLEVANLLKNRLLSAMPGVKVEMTRTDDRFLTLQERTALANSLNADLFISLHCNADSDSSSRGVETFYLSKASSPRAMRMAARENGIPLATMSDLQATLLDLMLTSKKSESAKLAKTVQSCLVKNLAKSAPKIRDRGIKRAPFYVLIGAKMPAILVECAFISNGREEQKLTSTGYLDSVALGIANGAATYLRGLGGKS